MAQARCPGRILHDRQHKAGQKAEGSGRAALRRALLFRDGIDTAAKPA